MASKFKAIVISFVGTVFPCLLAGGIVGLFFVSAFWYWTLGIAVLALCYSIIDRVHLRFYIGSLKGLSFWPLLKYGYAAPELRPTMSASEYEWYMNWVIYNTPFRLFRDHRRRKDPSSFHHW